MWLGARDGVEIRKRYSIISFQPSNTPSSDCSTTTISVDSANWTSLSAAAFIFVLSARQWIRVGGSAYWLETTRTRPLVLLLRSLEVSIVLSSSESSQVFLYDLSSSVTSQPDSPSAEPGCTSRASPSTGLRNGRAGQTLPPSSAIKRLMPTFYPEHARSWNSTYRSTLSGEFVFDDRFLFLPLYTHRYYHPRTTSL
ncbi:hypothetical protein EDC04DRAFT_1098876 [Pisolithus marmoratus]|nr:hypothetical protein EDC04DRAFT_1098876 [Pisolithus marmoratus]